MKPIVALWSLSRSSDGNGPLRAALAAASGLECVPVTNTAQVPPRGAALVVLACDHARGEAVTQAVQSLRDHPPTVPRLLICAEADAVDLVYWCKAGVDDFILWPAPVAALHARVARLIALPPKPDPVVERLTARVALDGFVGNSPALLAALSQIPLYAACGATVLIDGESGTGKELCARAVHYLSPRAARPFLAVNCGAIPVELIENELFGHERGAYTGATLSGRGLVEEAAGGTLFLDEIDALPPAAQVKLLRLLQEKEYRPLGSSKTRRVDVRFVAASNQNLLRQRQQGLIRDDFFYRISVLRLTLPPLRERGGDVIQLAEHFVELYAHELGRAPPSLTPAARRMLLTHDWPGNVRELQHVIERAVVLAAGRPVIDWSEFDLQRRAESDPLRFNDAKRAAVDRFEVNFIRGLLAAHGGNVARAARSAGKDPRALRALIRRHALDPAAYRTSSR
jgi:DNA-binding NtrC family response regulator